MTEINYEFEGLQTFVEKVASYFTGIDSIITELEQEQQALIDEKATLDNASDFTAKTLKRKATIGNELETTSAALNEAKRERLKIQETYWSEIQQGASNVFSEYTASFSDYFEQTNQEIDNLLLEAYEKFQQLQDIRKQQNAVFNKMVTGPVNEISGKHPQNKTNALSWQTYINQKSMNDRLDKLKASGKIKD